MPSITIVYKPTAIPGTYHQLLLYNDGTTTYFARGGPLNEGNYGQMASEGYGSIITQ